MKSTPFFAGIGLAALLSSCSVYHSAPIDLNAEEASWNCLLYTSDAADD